MKKQIIDKMSHIQPLALQAPARIAIVRADFYRDIADGLCNGAMCVLDHAVNADSSTVETFHVPGAFEVPVLCQSLTAVFDGVIALGAVIRGETAHFDYVCRGVTDGIMRVMIDTGVPIGFGILTADTRRQAEARASMDEHNKGIDAANAVIAVLNARRHAFA